LGRTAEFVQYEEQLRTWRWNLQHAQNDAAKVGKIRDEIIALRKELRLRGYDLRLGSRNLIFEGFRNDACVVEGFRRIVLFIGEGDLYWITGDDNHITLAEFLERRLASGHHPGPILGRHYLWYRRRGNDLVFSGADTEMKDDFERLRAMGEANSLLFLSKLKNL